jgi:hypothetical protein
MGDFLSGNHFLFVPDQTVRRALFSLYRPLTVSAGVKNRGLSNGFSLANSASLRYRASNEYSDLKSRIDFTVQKGTVSFGHV